MHPLNRKSIVSAKKKKTGIINYSKEKMKVTSVSMIVNRLSTRTFWTKKKGISFNWKRI